MWETEREKGYMREIKGNWKGDLPCFAPYAQNPRSATEYYKQCQYNGQNVGCRRGQSAMSEPRRTMRPTLAARRHGLVHTFMYCLGKACSCYVLAYHQTWGTV